MLVITLIWKKQTLWKSVPMVVWHVRLGSTTNCRIGNPVQNVQWIRLIPTMLPICRQIAWHVPRTLLRRQVLTNCGIVFVMLGFPETPAKSAQNASLDFLEVTFLNIFVQHANLIPTMWTMRQILMNIARPATVTKCQEVDLEENWNASVNQDSSQRYTRQALSGRVHPVPSAAFLNLSTPPSVRYAPWGLFQTQVPPQVPTLVPSVRMEAMLYWPDDQGVQNVVLERGKTCD
jgi:hypothetical protein